MQAKPPTVADAPPAQHWNDLVAGYDEMFAADASYRSLVATAVSLVPPGARSILDLGIGTGVLTGLCRKIAPEAHVTGLDPATKMLERAHAKFADDPLVTLVEGTASDLRRFDDGAFDVVVSNYALHHLTQVEKRTCAVEIFRVLAAGGVVAIADQFCRVMGVTGGLERVLDIFELLTGKARYYLHHASYERMLLQMDLLPRFLRDDGEILATTEYWEGALQDAGFAAPATIVIEPVEIYNRVVWATKANLGNGSSTIGTA
jgi:ubiquinone/menaquinone biosynthesis C-methylase UbiE